MKIYNYKISDRSRTNIKEIQEVISRSWGFDVPSSQASPGNAGKMAAWLRLVHAGWSGRRRVVRLYGEGLPLEQHLQLLRRDNSVLDRPLGLWRRPVDRVGV